MFSPVSHELVHSLTYFLMYVNYTQKGEKNPFTHFPWHKIRKTPRVMGYTRMYCEDTRLQSKPISLPDLDNQFLG